MKTQFRLFTVAGIPVRVHISFLLLLFAFVGYMFYLDTERIDIIGNTAFILTTFFCVLLHEFGHSFAAMRYGIRTREILILPIGGLARLESIPSKPVQELVVAIAGPLVNLVIASLLGIWLLYGLHYNVLEGSIVETQVEHLRSPENFAIMVCQSNILLAVFNMIPAFPMDGGRVLRALLATQLSRRRATQLAVYVGYILGGMGILWAAYHGSWLTVALAGFVMYSAFNEYAAVRFETSFNQVRVTDAMRPLTYSLTPEHTLADAYDGMLRYKEAAVLIFSSLPPTTLPLGTLSIEALSAGIRSNGRESLIDEHYSQRWVSAPAHATLAHIQHLISSHQIDVVVIIENEQIIGIVDDDTLDRARYLTDKGVM